MARSRTLLQLREEVRQRADMVNSAFVTNAEVDRCINQSWAQLYDRLLATGEDYYIKYVDLGPQAGTSTSPAGAVELQNAQPIPFIAVSPTLVGGYVWMVEGDNKIVAVDPQSGQLVAYLAAGSPIRREACTNGSLFVTASGNPFSVVGYNPTLPPTAAFTVTSWVPALGANEGMTARNGVYFDTVSGEYVTALYDSILLTSRIIRFTVAGSTATITASVSTPAAATITDVVQMLYYRTGFLGIWTDGQFQEYELSSMTATTTVAYASPLETGAFDAATGRAVASALTPPLYPVFDIASASLAGSLDAGIVAAGGTPALGFPRSVAGKWWISGYSDLGTPTVAGFPKLMECDPSTLGAVVLATFPSTTGIWADSFSPGVAMAFRSTFPFGLSHGSGSYDSSCIYMLGAAAQQTSTDFANFEDYTASNGQPATDVYQVRGVDAVYSSSVIVNLPRYNWEERNLYNSVPELTPYSPISAYRVIQNPLNGKDCIQFIPATPNGVSYYRVWYYPNPKVLTADTDTIDGRSGWEEWVVVDAAMKLLAKEESDTSQLEREAQRVWARIMAVAENRDAGQSKRVTDVSMNSGAWPYMTGFPRRF